MSRRLLTTVSAFAALGLASAFGQADNAASQDVVILKNGQTMSGTVSGRVDNGVQLSGRTSTGAQVTQVIPLVNVDRIEFANVDKLQEDIAKTSRADVGRMLQRWRKDSAFIDLPQSPAGAVGIRTAQLLLEVGGPDNAKTAGEILDTITAKDWNQVDKDRAAALAIESDRLAGRHDEAVAAARKFLASDASVEGKAEVSYYLGLALADDYRKFIEDNPRWESDPYMCLQRQRLYNEVLDDLLAPYLKYGAPPEITPKSLLSTVQFLDKYGENNEAVALAGDLTTIFGNSPEAAEAKKYLEKN